MSPTPSDNIGITDPLSFPDLDSATVGINVDPKYHEFKDGEIIRALFCGVMLRTIKGKTIPTAVFQTKNGFIMNAGVGLVSQVEALRPRSPIQIEYLGKKSVGSEGERTNLFNVNLLIVKEALPAVVPSPAIPATVTKTESDPPSGRKPRPLDPIVLKNKFIKTIEKNANTIATQYARGVLAVKLESCFDDDSADGRKAMRQTVTHYLIGKEHISEMNQAEVNALLDWIECRTHEQIPPDYVRQEAQAAYIVAFQTKESNE